jgi:hypothetical protein
VYWPFLLHLWLHTIITILKPFKPTFMIIVVNHKISDPQNFWGSAQESLPKLPEAGVTRVLQVMPNAAGTEATCVWEADDIDTLNTYLRNKVQDWSSEQFHEVNTANAMGLTV